MSIKSEWQTGQPPNEKFVEVELDNQIIQVKAFYGRDGWRPHWRDKNDSVYAVETFNRWRYINE